MKRAESYWMSIAEAAEFLGVCRTTIYNWMNLGIIRYLPDSRPRRLRRDDVVARSKQNWYAERDARNRRRRRPKMRPYRGDGQPLVSDEVFKLCAPYGYMAIQEENDKIALWQERHGRGDWDYAKHTSWKDDLLAEKRVITTREAADILGIASRTVLQLAQHGKLLRILKQERGVRRALYSLDQVEGLAADRQKRLRRRSKSPAEWNHDLLHPYVRTAVEAPPGDRLLTRQQAAEILGVSPIRVSDLVREGRLFGFQERPGRQGCRLYLSEKQLERYSMSWDRVRRREAFFGNRKSKIEDPKSDSVLSDGELFRETHGLTELTGRALKKDHGEYFTTAQAARVLGISERRVRGLRQRNVLLGYHLRRSPKDTRGSQYWFYRKEDVHALKSDPQYQDRSTRQKRPRAAALHGNYSDTKETG